MHRRRGRGAANRRRGADQHNDAFAAAFAHIPPFAEEPEAAHNNNGNGNENNNNNGNANNSYNGRDQNGDAENNNNNNNDIVEDIVEVGDDWDNEEENNVNQNDKNNNNAKNNNVENNNADNNNADNNANNNDDDNNNNNNGGAVKAGGNNNTNNNNITLDAVQEGVVSQKTQDTYLLKLVWFLKWCKENQPGWLYPAALQQITMAMEQRAGESVGTCNKRIQREIIGMVRLAWESPVLLLHTVSAEGIMEYTMTHRHRGTGRYLHKSSYGTFRAALFHLFCCQNRVGFNEDFAQELGGLFKFFFRILAQQPPPP